MDIDSHIQLPKGILKHFQASDGKVWYFDLQQERVGLAGAKKLGTQHGYFSNEMESFLNSNIETPITQVCARIRSFSEGKLQTLTLTQDDKKVIINYLKAAMIRSNQTKHSFLESSETACLCTDQSNNDALVYLSLVRTPETTKFLDAYQLGILVNKTSCKFVIPRNCYYTASSEGEDSILLPISPVCAIVLFPPKYTSNIVNGEVIRHMTVSSEDDVMFLNTRALLYEYIYNQTFVAGPDKGELERLKSCFINHKTDFDKVKRKLLNRTQSAPASEQEKNT